MFIDKCKDFFIRYSHSWVLLYFFIYMPWFNYLEATVTTDSTYTLIYSPIDDLIPFNELFVIPYILWFAYVAAAVLYFLFFAKKSDFYKLTGFLFSGMTICLIIYTFFPNGQGLRLTEFPRDNFLVVLVKSFYNNDTPTNVCPSIHCFNSIGVSIAILTCDKLKNKHFIKISSTIMTILIMLSTCFIKQHSIVDMFGAIVLSVILFSIIYLPSYIKKADTYNINTEQKKFSLFAK